MPDSRAAGLKATLCPPLPATPRRIPPRPSAHAGGMDGPCPGNGGDGHSAAAAATGLCFAHRGRYTSDRGGGGLFCPHRRQEKRPEDRQDTLQSHIERPPLFVAPSKMGRLPQRYQNAAVGRATLHAV